MKLCILSRGPKLYSTARLVEEAKLAGHEVEVIDPTRCFMNIASGKPIVHYKKRDLDSFDAVIPRIGASITFYGTAVLRQFEMSGAYAVNESVAISRSRDKLRSLQIMSKHGLGMPITGFAHSTRMTNDLIKMVGGAPCIIKMLEGTQGKGVVLAESNKAAEGVIDMLRGLNAHFLVQEFIKEAGGADIRCFVVGDKVIASMMRQGAEGEYRSNLHLGGSAKAITITPAERAAAMKAAKVMGLNVAGVDILRSKRGPLIMEVNSSPGLEGIEKYTEKNVASSIIKYIEKAVAEKKTNKTQDKG